MKKLILITMLMFLVAISVALAANTVNLDPQGILANDSFQTSQSITYNMNVTGNDTSWNCILYGNENLTNGAGTWRAIETNSGVSNNTNTNFTTRSAVAEVSGLAYNWDVFCNSTADPVGLWGGGSNATVGADGAFNYSVDVTAPTVTVTPADNAWNTDGIITITATTIDQNAANCTLASTINETDNSTQTLTDYTAISYTNNTAFNFSGFGDGNTTMADNGTGIYTYNVTCIDKADNSILVSSRTILVDSTAPTAFNFNLSEFKFGALNTTWINNTKATDFTPQVGWNATADDNFTRYRLRFYEDNLTSGTFIEKNVTTISQLFTSITTLLGDQTYRLLVTAFDLAGNSVNGSTTGYMYRTFSTGQSLVAGWSVLGNTGNAKTLSGFLNDTGASTACFLNATHDFQCHTSGGSLGAISVPTGQAYFVFLDAAGTNSDLLVNETALGLAISNITNQSETDWNIACNQDSADTDGFTFQEIDLNVNGNATDVLYNNITRMSYYNSSVTSNQYIPFRNNWTVNNATAIGLAECTWMFIDRAVITEQTVNWSAFS